MRYIDLHCDSLTAACDKRSELQINSDKLLSSDCAVQCFAIFTNGDNADKDFERYLQFAHKEREKHREIVPVRSAADLESCVQGGLTGGILTVENAGFIGGDLDKLSYIKEIGVKMCSLVWNDENSLAYPNLVSVKDFNLREERGLKPLGRRAVEMLDDMKIIVDISHLSDGGAEEILTMRALPTVASHSNADAVCPFCRNLTDKQLKLLANSGGVAGVNFCRDFLGGDDVFGSILKHLKHMIKVGGNDLPAFGSDFDGIPVYDEMKDCTKMPELLNYLNLNGIDAGTLEKIAYKNFSRVFKAVCG